MKENIIIYGAGRMGACFYNYLKRRGMDGAVKCFCDRNAENIKKIEDKDVITYGEAKLLSLPFVIAVNSDSLKKEIIQTIMDGDGKYYTDINEWAMSNDIDMVEWNRDFTAYFHIQEMDEYFSIAESSSNMDMFWKQDSIFYKMFNYLDLDNVVELACGRGRHVPLYEKQANKITLVDILKKNIDICRERFSDRTEINYYCNSGCDLKELSDNSYSALFTYDAMVHFEMMDIYLYLQEIYRILKPGSYALFHHSNNTSDYRHSFATAPNGRSFMSKDIFAYMAYRSCFEVVRQEVIDWGVKDLDCITLLRKPGIMGMKDNG